MTDKELLTQATRQLSIDGIMISHALQTQAGALIPAKLEEVVRVVRALTAAVKAVAAGHKQTKTRIIAAP